jgi:glutamine amidotransferase
MQTVAIIDYGSGNVRSVDRALTAAAGGANRRREVRITADPAFIRRADRIVLPGVGAFAACRAGLDVGQGLLEAVTDRVQRDGVPFLGICVGMQLLADFGREDQETAGLGWVHGVVDRIDPEPASLRVPHMGWNALTLAQPPHALWQGLRSGDHVYFTHSYVFRPEDEADVVARFDYGGTFTAALARDNMFGVQFHPEKSQAVGLKLLANWLDWNP